MATNIFDYSNSPVAASPTSLPVASPAMSSPVSAPPSPTPAATGQPAGLWGGHGKPAEVQIIVIVLIAGLFNAFFLTLSLRLLWRRYQHGPLVHHIPPAAAAAVPPDIEANIRRVTPMLVRQPDDELVYGLKQVIESEDVDSKQKQADSNAENGTARHSV